MIRRMYRMKRFGFLLLCLLFLLTGCSQQEATQPESRESEAEKNVVATDFSERHLPLYGMLDRYNEYDFFDGFTVSETEREGHLYYQFTRQDADVCLLMDEEGDAELSIGGQTTVFTASFMSAGGATGIHWTDLTDDGAPEFIYTEHWSGTGFQPNHCMIFDGATLKQLSWQDFSEDVKGAFSQITEVYVCGTEIDVDEDGRLMAYAVVMLPDAGIQQYFGSASGHMTWDEERDAFVLAGPLTVERYEEAGT